MLSIQGTGRSKRISGRFSNGKVEKSSKIICARKHVINDKGWRQLEKSSNVFAFVSSPKIYKQSRLSNLVKGWCHAFRKPDRYIKSSVPKILLPESDFMDPMFVPCKNIDVQKEYDFFYFTINAKPGIENKGLNVFIDSLPFFYAQKLKGLVVVYYPNSGHPKRFSVSLTRPQKEILRKYSKYLTFKWGLQSGSRMNKIMKSCRFGFFPNTVDNSPRLISECLIRNVPILVNKHIHGGWHYVSQDTGLEFDKESLGKSVEKVLNGKFNPNEYFMRHHGFVNSSQKLGSFLNQIFGCDYTHAYFSDFGSYLEKI